MIVVSGSTGNVGHELVPLVQRDLDVRCLVHAGRRSLRAADAEVLEVDLDRPETFVGALEGCERLFLLTPPHPAQSSGRPPSSTPRCGRGPATWWRSP